MKSPVKSLCVYCGSSEGLNPKFLQEAFALGEALAQNNIRLVFGGGSNGLMGAVARGALLKGGRVLGVIPEFITQFESQSELIGMEKRIVEDMHTRKRIMFEESDGFVALPGGIGTLEELTEVMTWAQLKRHTKPIMLYNIDGFWNPFQRLINHMSDEGLIRSKNDVLVKYKLNILDIVNEINQQ